MLNRPVGTPAFFEKPIISIGWQITLQKIAQLWYNQSVTFQFPLIAGSWHAGYELLGPLPGGGIQQCWYSEGKGDRSCIFA